MSAQIERLEALLARVQARAQEPRPVQASFSPAPSLPQMELDDPEFDHAPASTTEMTPDSLENDVIVDDVEEFDEIDDFEVDEHQPESGPVSAETMEQAMSAAEHQPPLTPPPESGEGIASPQIPHHDGPTMAQLGETISLDEGSARDFELDAPDFDDSETHDAAAAGELEADLPDSITTSDEPLSVPENAREELDRVRLGDSTPIEARVSTRPVLSTNVVELVQSSRSFEPKTFLELLDASLSLK